MAKEFEVGERVRFDRNKNVLLFLEPDWGRVNHKTDKGDYCVKFTVFGVFSPQELRSAVTKKKAKKRKK